MSSLTDFIKRQAASRAANRPPSQSSINRPNSAASFNRDAPPSPTSDINTTAIFSPPRSFSPSAHDERAPMFDTTSASLSLSGGSDIVNVDPAHRERMERMKLPVPSFGQNPSQQGDDKKGVSGRKKSEDSLEETDQKPAGFGNQHGYRNELPYGYHSDEDYSYEGGTEGTYKQEQQGEQYYDVNDGYDGLYDPDEDDPRYQIKQEEVDDMWRDETPSVSDRNFNDGYNEPSSPPAPLRMAVPERSKSANTFRPKPLAVATKNGVGNRQKASAQPQIYHRRPSAPEPVSDPFIHRPATVIPAPQHAPTVSATRRQVTVRQPSPPPSRLPAMVDPDRTIRPQQQYEDRQPTIPLTEPPSLLGSQPLLSDAELNAIPTYSALIETLRSRYLSSRSNPPTNMAQELETIIKFAYPERDTTRPTRFFEALPDDAYEHAGEEILRQKREIEEKLKLAGRKRRKLVDEKVKDLEAVAQERLERLERLNALRQQFRRGVAGLLSMSGMSV